MDNKKNNWSTRVYNYLHKAIINGKFNDKEQLSEQEIANKLGCSRTPVRDALKKLEHEGFVEIEANKGAFIKPFTFKDALEIFQIREALEGIAARIAAKMMPEKVIEHFTNEFNRKEMTIKDKTDVGYKFHQNIRKWSNNERLNSILENYMYQIKRINKMSESIPGSQEEAHEQHLLLLESIKMRDEELAEKRMREHIVATRNLTLENYQFFNNFD